MESRNRKHGKRQESLFRGYDVEAASEKAKENPDGFTLVSEIFSAVFIGGIADGLLEEGVLDRGITWWKLLIMM